MTAEVHVVGQAVTYSDGEGLHLRRQRCSWCGTLLDEIDLARVAVHVAPGEEPEPIATWAEGSLMEIERLPDPVPGLLAIGIRQIVAAVGDVGGLPPNACMLIDPDVTR